MRNCPLPELLLLSNELLFKATPPSSLLFLHKVILLFFLCGTCQWCCYGLLVPNFNSLLFLSKPIIAGKITFVFKINITYQVVSFYHFRFAFIFLMREWTQFDIWLETSFHSKLEVGRLIFPHHSSNTVSKRVISPYREKK